MFPLILLSPSCLLNQFLPCSIHGLLSQPLFPSPPLSPQCFLLCPSAPSIPHSPVPHCLFNCLCSSLYLISPSALFLLSSSVSCSLLSMCPSPFLLSGDNTKQSPKCGSHGPLQLNTLSFNVGPFSGSDILYIQFRCNSNQFRSTLDPQRPALGPNSS